MNEIYGYGPQSVVFPVKREKVKNPTADQAILPEIGHSPFDNLPGSETLKTMMGVIENKANRLTAKFALSGKLGLHDIKALTQTIKVTDENSKSVAMLLTLVDEGVVNPRTLRYVCKNGTISDAMNKDIKMIFSSRAQGIDPNDRYIPLVENEKEGILQSGIGDMFVLPEERNVFIKTDKGKVEQLKMDKETMIKLFPPAERFANAQTYSGDCYFVAAVNSMMENPKARIKFLKCFEQDGKDVKINFPASDFVYVAKNGEMPKNYKHNFLTGCTGMKLIEYAYGRYLEDLVAKQVRIQQTEAIKKLEEQIETEKDKSKLSELKIKLRRHNIMLENFEKDQERKEKSLVVSLDDYRRPIMTDGDGIVLREIGQMNFYRKTTFDEPGDFYRGDGGVMEDVFNDFGYKDVKAYHIEEEEIQELLKDPVKSKEYLFTGGTKREGRPNFLRAELIMDRSLSMFGGHAYKIEPTQTKDGKMIYKVSNSWNASHNPILTLEQLNKFFSQIHIAKIE